MLLKIGLTGLLFTIGTFFGGFILSQNALPFSVITCLVLAGSAALFVAIYFMLVSAAAMRKASSPAYDLQEDERVVHESKYHKIQLLPCAVLIPIGGLLCFVGVALWIYNPDVSFNIPQVNFDASSEKVETASRQYGFPIWELPIIASLVAFFPALLIWQNWKWSSRIITTDRLIQLREQSTYFFWLGRVNDPIQLDQITDLNDKSGVFGSIFGWGTVVVERIRSTPVDQAAILTMRLVPECQEFVAILRPLCPALKRKKPKPED